MSDVIGYRFSVDEHEEVYIITVSAPNEQREITNHSYFYSENCRCISIKNATTGQECDEAVLSGIRRNKVLYRKDEILPGKTWYVHSVDELFQRFLNTDTDGQVIYHDKGQLIVARIEEAISDLCQASLEEVADEMRISLDDLQQQIEFCKRNTKSQEAHKTADSILAAGSNVYNRKLKNGEIEPGWKKYLKKYLKNAGLE